MTEPQSLDARIADLERSNRLLKIAVAALLPLIGAALFIAWQGRGAGGAPASAPGADAAAPAVLHARAVVIHDNAGKIRAEISCEQEGDAPYVRLLDAAGNTRVGLGLGGDGAGGLSLYAEDQSPRAALGTFGGGATGLLLFDGSRPRARIEVAADGAPALRLVDAAGGAVFEKP